ncbi:MAG: type II toxin-antitoxin system RelB/DinJ family antitoxin [Kiritimatiellaeota bacterium]|nr:type II toxin-antitoxin system RelB/DinJ family antitoxin [Kiritimatiellota bacterium]
MGYAIVNVRVDTDVKRGIEEFCAEVGMNVSTAVNLFFKAVLTQRKIPFDIALPDDPFYRGANWRHIEKALAEWNNPKAPKIVKTMEELEAMANE